MVRRSLAVLGLGALLACGGGVTRLNVFSTTWTDDDGESIKRVQRELAGVKVPLGADVAVAVVHHSARLVGQPLSGGPRWTFDHALDARPTITGNVVVASGGGELFALDALTGRKLWARPTGGLAFHGAGDDGSITVVTMASALGSGSSLLAVAHDGSVARQIEVPVDLGTPAVVSRLAFVPWNNQYVSVLDVTDGTEVGRALLREKTSRAWLSGGALYFGEIGLFRFDAQIGAASHGGADHLSLPTKPLPGHPLLMHSGSSAEASAAGAADKVRLYARPTASTEPLALDDGRFYATYFRLALGLAADGGSLAWVHTHGPALIGGAAARSSLVLCDADGALTFLDGRSGGALGEPLSFGEPIESCVVQADGFQRAGSPKDPGSLLGQIRKALADRDLELGSAQALLLRELGGLPDEEGTALLLSIAGDPRTTPEVLGEARAALATRRSGSRYLILALEKHYDFLHDVTVPPPIGALARALAAAGDSTGAAALTLHLLDPATSDEDLRDVAQALRTLATPAETHSLIRFLALYRDAPPAPEEVPAAVNAIGEALLRVGGAEGRQAVDAALRSPATNAVVRAKLGALVESQSLQRSAPSTTPNSTSRE